MKENRENFSRSSSEYWATDEMWLAWRLAEAVMFGIQVAFQAKCVPIIIESDSSEVVELSLKRKSSMAEICWTVEEIQVNLKNQSRASIQFVPR